MDFVKRLHGQLIELVRAMTPRARVTVGGLILAVLLGLAYLTQQKLAGETTYLLGGQPFSSDELTTVQGALGKAQLNDFTVEGNRLRIPKSKQAAYLAALADGNALPQTLTDIFSEGNEKTNWWSTRQQQVAQARATKKKWLSLMLRSMNGVESADVEFDKEESRGWKPTQIATALVAVKMRGGQPLTEDRAAYFQRVAAAALNMSPPDVTVVDRNSDLVVGGANAQGTVGAADDYLNLKRKYQADYEAKLHKALSYVPGVMVSAEVELDREQRREGARAPLDANGPLGIANQPANLRGFPAARPNSGEETGLVATNAPPTLQQNRTDSPGWTPRQVKVSVGVPTSYFDEIWRRRHSDRAADHAVAPPADELAQIELAEIARIRQCASGLIPNSDAAATEPLVTVTPFFHAVPSEAVKPPLAALVSAWLVSSGPEVAVILIAIVGLAALRLALRHVVRRPPQVQQTATGATESRSTGGPHVSRLRADLAQRISSGRPSREDLADIVREDPAAAANVLRSWIGNVN